jgi:hypothetical protein
MDIVSAADLLKTAIMVASSWTGDVANYERIPLQPSLRFKSSSAVDRIDILRVSAEEGEQLAFSCVRQLAEGERLREPIRPPLPAPSAERNWNRLSSPRAPHARPLPDQQQPMRQVLLVLAR